MENKGMLAWRARAALREMDVYEVDEWWITGELVTRFECERTLGLIEECEEALHECERILGVGEFSE